MLTPRENLLQIIQGGKPEYLMDQRSYLGAVFDPIITDAVGFCEVGQTIKNAWGATITWSEGQPGPYPSDTAETRVIKDIEQWKDAVIPPDPASYTEDDWTPYMEAAAKVDRSQQFVTVEMPQGIFEKIHYLAGMEDTLCAFMEYPDEMHELIDYMVDWELKVAQIQLERFQPDALFHADDFGTQIGTLFSREVMQEFLVPAYQKLYGFWKDNGVQLIVHHNDAYSAPFVPEFIDMGIDIWQGPVTENDLPALVKEYGGRISFQGGIDNGKFDVKDWSYDKIRDHVKALVESTGTLYMIPSFTSAAPGSAFPGAYEAASKAIAEVSQELFGASQPPITQKA